MPLRLSALVSCLLALSGPVFCGLAAAQDSPARDAEPAVQHIVVEDNGARIEELRVRGQTRRLSVLPKGGARRYDILTNDHAADLSDSVDGPRSGAGKRVWSVMSF